MVHQIDDSKISTSCVFGEVGKAQAPDGLVDVDEYGVAGADMLYGFVAGVLAGNYDITELFLDGILRITDHDMAAAAKVLNAIDKITSNIEVVVTVSANAADLPEDLKKFVI